MKNILVAGIVAILVTGVVLALQSAPAPQPRAGATIQDNIVSRSLTVNGLRREFPRQTFAAATSTPCSILSPAATSSLVSYGYQIYTATGTAATFDVGTSTTPYATTTTNNFITQRVIAANAQDTFFITASTTALGQNNLNNILAPNTYLNFKTGNSALGGYTWGGTCQATFETITS